jgi:hypothetical protein
LLLGLGHATHQFQVGRLELRDAVIECRVGFSERRELGLQRCRFASLEIGNTYCSVGICVEKEAQKHTCSAKSALTIFASRARRFMISVMSTSSLASASLASILWNEVEERGLECECEREREREGDGGGSISGIWIWEGCVYACEEGWGWELGLAWDGIWEWEYICERGLEYGRD